MALKELKRMTRKELLKLLVAQINRNERLYSRLCLAETELYGEVVSEHVQSVLEHDASEVNAEIQRINHKKRYRYVLRSTVSSLVVVAAIAVLIAVFLLPVLQIYGHSMTPTLNEGEIVLCVKDFAFEPGDLVAFYIGNKLLVKRFVAASGQWVNIDEDGNVSVNGSYLEEPYIAEKALGNCNIELPYQVPEKRIFCLGDHRSTSLDSRSSVVGCIADEQVVGRVIFRIWPLSEFGPVQ